MNNELSTGCFKVSILIYLLFFNALCFLKMNIVNNESEDVLLQYFINLKSLDIPYAHFLTIHLIKW